MSPFGHFVDQTFAKVTVQVKQLIVCRSLMVETCDGEWQLDTKAESTVQEEIFPGSANMMK